MHAAPSRSVFQTYVHNIEGAYHSGQATEHSYRADLKQLIERLSPGIVALNEPKRVACGAPDFVISREQTPLGYIETKDIAVPLDRIERSDQMRRYRESLANLVLTDYLEFRWYVTGEPRIVARLARPSKKSAWHIDAESAEQVNELLQNFFASQAPIVASPKELATRMAATARLIREAIEKAFSSEEGGGSLHAQMEGFRKVLLPDLSAEQFADMYAQTICYGLFAARCNVPASATFTREHAARDIPKTNPFLRKMFNHIAGLDFDDRIAWAVDDLAATLSRADMTAILRDFGRRTRQEDPVVHFYETFLAAYDPRMREARGVYYTPEPVVSYIVRSVDHLLKTDFHLPDGLADATRITVKVTDKDGETRERETHKVQILDPATGTGTFLHSVIDLIYDAFKGNQGLWSGYVSQHLLPRLFGFELLMAPYAVAHMKLGLQLKETGYDFRGSERLGVYLTNTLESGFGSGTLPFAEWLVEEAKAAGGVKYDAPVMVVVGNPPYSVSSQNTGDWIRGLVKDYYMVDEQPLQERNPKSLQDDYVKFIRFAQWRIQRTGYGILALITNHGYLDNPTFRGMRRSLMQSFDEIYVLDLHGNSNKKERSPDGTQDENVFDIQQGVAIGIFVRYAERKRKPATVHHAQLWGKREVHEDASHQFVSGKYAWLWHNDLATTQWATLSPQKPFYLFVPQDTALRDEYEKGWNVTAVLSTYSSGMNTARDSLVIDSDKETLIRRIQRIADASEKPEQLAERFGVQNTGWWNFGGAIKNLRETQSWQQLIIPCLYRPFDQRWLFYHPSFIDRPRTEVNADMLQKNISLVTTRQTKEPFAAMATQLVCGQHKIAAVYDRSFVFPLYHYPDSSKSVLFDLEEPSPAPGGRRSNLALAFTAEMNTKLGLHFVEDGRGDLRETFGPEDVFNYLYAVFYSPTYRARYAEFLKIDFPRLPLTSNVALFRDLCGLGRRLVALHVMEQIGTALPSYPVAGNNVVEKIEYRVSPDEPERGRVYINGEQYFESVPPDVWEFHVGGYQVCHKWLKDRKGRALSYEDVTHYRRVVAALAETITLMERIDATIEACGGWPMV
ncbi:MAG: type ISP restriction/modification enzyme [Ktedonobacteraceae bacterium]